MNENNIYISNEISREELIKTFEILFEIQLINAKELQNAISLITDRYKTINQLKLK